MPRYFLLIIGRNREIDDDVGAIHSSPEEALKEAERVARELSEGDPDEFGGCRIELHDEAGNIIANLMTAFRQTRH